MRPELRCHAVLCKKAEEPIEICTALTDSLHAALLVDIFNIDFKYLSWVYRSIVEKNQP